MVSVRVVLVTAVVFVACGMPMGPVDAGASGGGTSGGGTSGGGTSGGGTGGGGAAELCRPSNCDGCCTTLGVCVTTAAVSSQQCGQGGTLCQVCAGAQQCVSGACVSSTGGGSAGGSAGGAAGGVAGGDAGGAAGGVAGGTAGGAGGGAAGGSAGGMAGGAAGGAADAGTDGGSSNQPPFVNGIIVTRPGSTAPLTGPVLAGQVIQFSVDALDPEGDPLSYSWSVDGGTLSNAQGMQPTWFSPVVNVNFVSQGLPAFPVNVSVSDGVNPPVSAMVDVTVRAPQLVDLLAIGAVLGRTTPGSCASSSCHGSATPTGGLRIQPTNASATRTALLMNMMRAGCFPAARVVPLQPDSSLLIRKVDTSIALTPSCGARMPLAPNPMLPANEIIGLRSWIAAGANQ